MAMPRGPCDRPRDAKHDWSATRAARRPAGALAPVAGLPGILDGHALQPRFLARYIVLATDRQVSLLGQLGRPVAEVVAKPRGLGAQGRQPLFLPDRAGALHILAPRQRHRGVAPLTRGVDENCRRAVDRL